VNAPLNEEVTRLKAVSILHAATVHSLLLLVARQHEVLRRVAPEKLGDFVQQFLAVQRDAIHVQLERIEHTNPELAAHLQELIDKEGKGSFPCDYQ